MKKLYFLIIAFCFFSKLTFSQCSFTSSVSLQQVSGNNYNINCSTTASNPAFVSIHLDWPSGFANFSNDTANFTFPGPGTYEVCLQVHDTTGGISCWDSTCALITIDPATGPNCPLSVNITDTVSPQYYDSYTFYGTASTVNIQNAYFKIFPGNTLVPNASPVNLGFNNGTYNVCYYVIDSTLSGLCFDSACALITVGPPPPPVCPIVAQITDAQLGSTNIYNFQGSFGVSWSGYEYEYFEIVETQEIFGYQTNNVNYAFPSNGIYHVNYWVVDSLSPSCSDSAGITINVSGHAPPCNLSPNFTFSGNTSGNFTFTGTNTAVNPISEYIYFTQTGISFSLPSSQTINLPFNSLIPVCYYVYDSTLAGVCYDSLCTIINTGPVPCNAYFTLSEDTSIHPAGSWYGYNTSSGNGSISYLWNFGDGTTDTAAYPTHIYSIPGWYYICLTVSDHAGCTSTYCDSAAAFKYAAGLHPDFIYQLNIIDPLLAGLNQNSNSQNIKLYPNPASDILFIQTQNIFLDEDYKVFAIDLSGRKIQFEYEKKENKFSASLDKMNDGIYFIEVISSEGKVFHQKFQVSR